MFGLKKHKTEVKTELIAALTTFFTLSYILAINPKFLADAGMDYGAVFVATALSAGIATLMMGLVANRPFALAAGMGLNSYFAYSVVMKMGFTWQAGLAAVFASNALILLAIISGLNLGKAIPQGFRHALIAGLGLFLIFIGMQNAHFIQTNESTLISLGDLTKPNALIAVVGFFITSALVARKVKGGMFLGMLATTVIAMAVGFAPLPERIFEMPPDVLKVAGQVDYSALLNPLLLPVIWSLFIITFLDVLGTTTALGMRAGKKADGRMELAANAAGGAIGANLGSTSIVTYLESAAGIESGGRTGLTAVFIAALFFISIFLFPLVKAIPIEAAAPVIVIVGAMMLLELRFINLKDYSEAIPALMAVATIPFTFSISNGIGVGAISYIFLKWVNGKQKEVHPAMYVIALLSALEFAKIV